MDGLAWTRVYDSDAVQEFEDRAQAESAINMTMMNASSHRCERTDRTVPTALAGLVCSPDSHVARVGPGS